MHFIIFWKRKNAKFIINGSDKKLGSTAAEKEDVIKECKRQLYAANTSVTLSKLEIEYSLLEFNLNV